jgi:hypothetical protein
VPDVTWKSFGIVAFVAVGCGEAFVAANGKDAASDHSVDDDALADAGQDANEDADAFFDAGLDADAPSEDGDVDAGAPWSPVCPVDRPKVGSTCPKDGVVCEYGVPQYDIGCAAVLGCTAGRWVTDTAFKSFGCQLDGPNPLKCPVNLQAVMGSIAGTTGGKCSDDNLRCEYPKGVCICSAPPGGVELGDAGLAWSCNPGTGCPMPRPRLGASCAGAVGTSKLCTYQSCEFGEECADGYWQGQTVVCMSARH